MAGKTFELIQQVIKKRTDGKESLQHFIRAQMLLRGIDPDKHTSTTEDNPELVAKLQKMLTDFEG